MGPRWALDGALRNFLLLMNVTLMLVPCLITACYHQNGTDEVVQMHVDSPLPFKHIPKARAWQKLEEISSKYSIFDLL